MELRVEKHGDILLTPDFWNCECMDNYIHASTTNTEGRCEICGLTEEEGPDSHVLELLEQSLRKEQTGKLTVTFIIKE